MTKETNGKEPLPRDAANWAKPVDMLNITEKQAGTAPINVAGRQPVGVVQGFGQMWQKTYRIRLSGVTAQPAEVIAVWKQHFPEFWPKGNRFFGPITGIAPGEIGVINVSMGGMKLSTGVRVIYADDESFTFMTPQGHMFAGWITFSAFAEDGATAVQVQALIRANDPIYEMGFRMGFGHRAEDEFWHNTLKALARHFGVVNGMVAQQVECLDPRVQWSRITNIRYNAAIHTMIYQITAPARWVLNLGKRASRETKG
ncbi:MAG: hypothetical protein KF726_00585 [Anaerolineae bacterium]|nr:hypothetical protein [Anaerolineae bacterium]